MRPLLFFLWGLVLAGMVACADKKATEDQSEATETGAPTTSALPPAEVTSQPGTPLIADPTQAVPVEGLFLNPYFDEKGTLTRTAVKAGDQFSVYVFAETVDPYPTSAAQFRVEFPAGVKVLGTDEFEHKSISLGNHEQNYMIAFDCQPPGRFRITGYRCVAEPDFRGGDVKVLDGLPGSGVSFLGFTTCEFVEVRAAGGSATMNVK